MAFFQTFRCWACQTRQKEGEETKVNWAVFSLYKSRFVHVNLTIHKLAPSYKLFFFWHKKKKPTKPQLHRLAIALNVITRQASWIKGNYS